MANTKIRAIIFFAAKDGEALYSQQKQNQELIALEKGMATHSSVLAWRIPWTEEPGGLQSMASQRVGHDLVMFTTTAASIKDLGSRLGWK